MFVDLLKCERRKNSQFTINRYLHLKAVLQYNTCLCIPVQVIICTDGLANKGVGNLDGKHNTCT